MTLTVRDLTVRFGGVVAVDNVSLEAPGAAVTGLIGPNGAGKTTIFNACAGLVRPASGSVELDGHPLGDQSPAGRARVGLGRTFQQVALLDSATVEANVALGYECRRVGRRWWALLVGGRADPAVVAAAIARCGISDLADTRAGDLPTGQRRLVELARAIAAGFRFLLLDEPSSGLDETETDRVAGVLRGLAADGTGILLVEHDIRLVHDVCETVAVLDFGELLVHGETSEVLASEVVRAAYLGSEELV